MELVIGHEQPRSKQIKSMAHHSLSSSRLAGLSVINQLCLFYGSSELISYAMRPR